VYSVFSFEFSMHPQYVFDLRLSDPLATKAGAMEVTIKTHVCAYGCAHTEEKK